MQKTKIIRGYVTLVSILVIGAIGLSVTTSLVLLGLGSSRTSLALETGNQARALANTCVEEALQQIWKRDVYVGSGSLILGQGNCTYTVSNLVVPKTVSAVGIIGTTKRRVSVVVNSLHPYVAISSWQEVAD